jgi:hypothetical protein
LPTSPSWARPATISARAELEKLATVEGAVTTTAKFRISEFAVS